MARLPRIDLPGYPQHLMVRGNNRADLFRGDADRFVFLEFLGKALTERGCELHAFVLMTNHVHLLATGLEFGSVSAMMQSLGRRFARYVNARYGRSGTLFEGRFRASLVETDRYLLTCMRYIELNPVRAGLAARPPDYAWSSHRANASGAPGLPLTPHATYLELGSTDLSRASAYRRLFETGLTGPEVLEIRTALWKNRALATPEFCAGLEGELHRPVAVSGHGGARRFKGTD